MKPDSNHNLPESLLEALLSGESAASLARENPAYALELAAYEKMFGTLSALHQEMPSPEGLRRALAAGRVAAARKAMPSPYSFAFMYTYRNAFALPLLVLVLAASGWFLIPHNTAAPGTATQPVSDTAAQGTASTLSQQAPVPAAASKKMATLASPATFADPRLADVFTSEVASDATPAAPTINDTQDTAPFTAAYDSHEL